MGASGPHFLFGFPYTRCAKGEGNYRFMEATMSAQSADERPALGLSEVLSVARRRKFHFALTAVVVLAVAVAVIFALPPVYRSTASILIESQQIPTDLVRSTITSYAEERIEFIRQKVLTRANILEVIEIGRAHV